MTTDEASNDNSVLVHNPEIKSLNHFSNDSYLRIFLTPLPYGNTSLAMKSLEITSLADAIQKLSNALSLIEHDIRMHISCNHKFILSQAHGLESLEGVLQMMERRITAIIASIEKIRVRIREPYKNVALRTTQLGRLQCACDILRGIIRMLFLMKKLRAQINPGSQEIVKIAQTLSDIAFLQSDIDLTGINILREDLEFIKQVRADIEEQAEAMIKLGIDEQNMSHLGVGLQTFYQLGDLELCLQQALINVMDKLQLDMQISLDHTTMNEPVPGPQGSKYSQTTPSAVFRANLWARIERLMNHFQFSHSQILLLNVVLSTRKDPLSHITLIETLTAKNFPNLIVNFWDETAKIISAEFTAAYTNSPQICQAFEQEYSKLLRLFKELFERVKESSPEHAHYDPEPSIRVALAKFETAFLSQSFSRLSEPVNQSLADRQPPSFSDINTIVRIFQSELQMVGNDNQLSRVVTQNITKSLRIFKTRCEQMLSTGAEAIQICSTSTQPQLTNQAISNALYRMSTLIFDLLTSLPESEEVSSIFQENIASLKEASNQCVQPLLKSIMLAMHEIICSMHRESFAGEDVENNERNIECSHFINELQNFVSRVKHDHLEPYDFFHSVPMHYESLLTYCIQAYVFNCCMVKPLQPLGVMRMTIDLTQLEVVLGPLYKERLSEIGVAYKMLRCLRKLIHADLQELSNCQPLFESLPKSYVLLHLISIADPSFRLPHQLKGSTLEQFSEWAIKSTDEDILSKVRESLADYEETITSIHHSTNQLAPVYPLIKQLLD